MGLRHDICTCVALRWPTTSGAPGRSNRRASSKPAPRFHPLRDRTRQCRRYRAYPNRCAESSSLPNASSSWRHVGRDHAFTRRRVGGPGLLERLTQNRKTLVASYASTVKAVQERKWISPAADWLINNFHVIQEQLREAREDLPRTYYRDLPKLVGGTHSGLPRVYGWRPKSSPIATEARDRYARAFRSCLSGRLTTWDWRALGHSHRVTRGAHREPRAHRAQGRSGA